MYRSREWPLAGWSLAAAEPSGRSSEDADIMSSRFIRDSYRSARVFGSARPHLQSHPDKDSMCSMHSVSL